MIIEMHQAGCDLTRNIGIIVDNKETDQNKVSLVKSCDRVYRALEDNQERLAQGKKLFSDNDVKSIESNLQWLNSTFDHHCAIVYVPRIATTESGLRIKLTKNKLVD
ncbi:MAG: hypothetical protein JNL11_11885 [Bdellovibrionaceae bacterium]|nr:hypothetical protein [Pseudobdellovibrionaceae bacterium]